MHKVNDEWVRVRNEMYELRKQEIEEQKEILKTHIGRCFKREDSDIWCIIIDVPQEYHTMTGIDFNEHQLPAMFLYFKSCDQDTMGRAVLDYDTFFIGDLPEREHPLKSMQKVFWKEVSPELFWKVYDKFCNTVRAQVQGAWRRPLHPNLQNWPNRVYPKKNLTAVGLKQTKNSQRK